jgi:hypothetical protein
MWLWILTRSLSAPVGLLWGFCGTPWPTWMWYYYMGICTAKALHFVEFYVDKCNGKALHFFQKKSMLFARPEIMQWSNTL